MALVCSNGSLILQQVHKKDNERYSFLVESSKKTSKISTRKRLKFRAGLPIMGYEIDQGWWESKFSPPKFWNEIECINPAIMPRLDPQFALLFCYFNNSKAFEAYLNSFTGDCVILIGPDEKNKNRYCDPQPFQLKESEGWRIHAIWRTKFLEAIVIYRKCVN